MYIQPPSWITCSTALVWCQPQDQVLFKERIHFETWHLNGISRVPLHHSLQCFVVKTLVPDYHCTTQHTSSGSSCYTITWNHLPSLWPSAGCALLPHYTSYHMTWLAFPPLEPLPARLLYAVRQIALNILTIRSPNPNLTFTSAARFRASWASFLALSNFSAS